MDGGGMDGSGIRDGQAGGAYRVLARKYRPRSFDDLVGQEPMVRTLTNAFSTGRIAQAYMLTGVRGVGKTTTARILARGLNYAVPGKVDRPTIDMPELGIHCAEIMEGRHVDVIEMDAASNNGIDHIREIIEAVRYKPVSARYKVYILDEVHMLSGAAFNGLLKTLEEPPEHVKFIFATTEIRKVPVTVLSRCQRFDLRRIEQDRLIGLLRSITVRESVEIDDEALAMIARAAEGSARDSLSLLDQAKERGFTVVGNLDELNGVTSADQDKPLLGLFAEGNMPVRWKGPKASHHGNIDAEPVSCEPNAERAASVPTLAEMTTKAIDLLKGNEKGFFLQVEGASIDKQDHAANPCGQIGETVDLDEAVQKALEFAKADGKTLVIVTADHAHSSQIIPDGTKAPGLTQALTTRDGSVMTVSYGNAEEDDQEHTGAQLRVAAFGPYAANFVGLTDQTDMFYTISEALKLQPEQRASAE